MRAHQRPLDRRQGLELRLGIRIAEPLARLEGVVLGAQIGDLLFNSSSRESYAARRSQNSVSPPRSGSTTADEHRVLRRRLLERAVAVPELVGEIADGFRVRAPGDLAVDADVGDVDQSALLNRCAPP